MSTKTFANNIIRTQKAFGLNETDLSYALNKSRRTLGRIKAATPNYTPSEDTVSTLARAYRVSYNEVTKRLPAAVIYNVL